MITELLRKKRDGLALNQAEIDEFISGCLSGEAADGRGGRSPPAAPAEP